MTAHRRSAVVLALATLALAASASAGPVAEWDPSAARAAGGKVSVPDVASGMNFEGGPDTDSVIEQSSDFPEGAAIVFGGSQTKSMRTIAGRTALIGSGTGLEMSFFPEATADDMTIFTSPGLELRYVGSRERLDVIVYYATEDQKNNYVALTMEAKPGQWNKLKVNITDTELSGDLNGMTQSKPLLNAIRAEAAALQLGMKNDARPFRGKVGKFTLTQD